MMLSLLLESALRSLSLGAITWFCLKALRVRNPQVSLTAWTIVLAGALAMPLLMQIAVLTIPARLPLPASLADLMPALPVPSAETSSPAPWTEPAVASFQTTTDPAIHWRALATTGYLAIAGALLTRALIGLAMSWSLLRTAQPIRETWTRGRDVRMCGAIAMPATFAQTILLPTDHFQWSALTRQAVLAHERAHVARADYWVLLLAAIHRAIFWFNPLSWWLLNRLAALMEAASDDAAIADLRDRGAYAQILLDISRRAGRLPHGVAMARPATVARRIDRILSEKALPTHLGWRQRSLVAAGLLPVTAVAAAAIAQGFPAEPELITDNPAIVSADEVPAVSVEPRKFNPLEMPRVRLQLSPVVSKAPVAVSAVSLALLQPVRVPTLAAAEDTKPATAQLIDITGTWSIRGSPAGRGQEAASCTFQQTGNELRGICRNIFVQGPITGSVNGRKVEWRWLYKVGVSARTLHDYKVAVYTATLRTNNRLEGGVLVYHTYDQFHPSFEHKDTLLFRFPSYFTANKQPPGSE
jgi:beta-lactamase regulating signal transducer with metallopeptidase domain